MSIRFAPEPRNGPVVVRAGLDRLATRESPLKLSRDAFSALTLESSHAVYDLRADEISKGGDLSTAHLTGFRYLVKLSGASVAAAEVHTGPDGEASLLANLNYGPFVEATARAFDSLSNMANTKASSYEARFLRFAAIFLIAIWLKEDNGADLIFPLAPAPDGIQAGRLYTADEFLTAIRPLAQRRTEKNSESPLP